jgi:hypothetical protein
MYSHSTDRDRIRWKFLQDRAVLGLRPEHDTPAAGRLQDQKLRFSESDHWRGMPGLAAVVPELLLGPMPVQ